MQQYIDGEFTMTFAGAGLLPALIAAESLEGWSGIYSRVPKVLAQYHPAFKGMRAHVFVESIEEGSWVTKVLLRLSFKDNEAAEQFENDSIALAEMGQDHLLSSISNMTTTGKSMVSAVVGGFIAYGTLNMLGYLDVERRNVIYDNSTIINNQGGIILNVTPKEFVTRIERAVTDNARLTKDTLSAMRPASCLDDGSLSIQGGTEIVGIDGDAAKIIASVNYEDLQPRIETRRLLGKVFVIRALDLDKKNSGWAAIIPDLGDRRIPLTLDPRVSINSVGQFTGDIDVEVAIDLDGNETIRKARVVAADQI